MHHFYILYSPSKDKYYIGSTSDSLTERLKKHQSNHKGFTGSINDWVIIYTEIYSTKGEVIKREKVVKAWKSRKMIEVLVKKNNSVDS